ncbi:MAG TPA: histidine kinase [Usitatibacteraceae bacterium]|nr:histidine kinase [Usitatibacteraceae bacterium]
MFKAFGNFIHRTPWWAMILLGFSVLLLLVAVSAPVKVIRMSETGATPEERAAIKREIDKAVGDSALNFAENIVEAIKDRSADPARRAELEHALAEIAQARREIYTAQKEAVNSAREAAREASNAAMQAAVDAAQSALDAATTAREAVEEAKRDAADKLKSTGADTSAALKAFDDMIADARAKETTAREEVKKLKDAMKRGISIGINLGEGVKIGVDASKGEGASGSVSIDEKGVVKKLNMPLADARGTAKPHPAPPKAPAAPGTPDAPKVPVAADGVSFDGTIAGKRVSGNIALDDKGGVKIDLPDPPLPPLPPDLRETIKSSVASDVRRIGIGSAAVVIFIPLFIMILVAKVFIGRSRRAQEFAEQKKKEAEQSDVNRQVVEARLQALQAQVEPHFLYNTLANVQALTEVDPNQANQMTGHLIQYLRSSLPKMRENTSTVGQEIELVRAYLNILKMRMGERLDFGIDCADDLLKTPFPPMMLPSLVENAIKHGLEPQKEGGRIDVVVTPMMTALGKRIRIAVKDTGKGLSEMSATAGSGLGLSNIRERLIALYGEHGRLTLESNDPKGVVATIEVPAEPLPAASAASAPPKPAPRPGWLGWWDRSKSAAATTHGVWARIMSTTFITLMISVGVLFGLAFAAMLAGVLPVNIGGMQLEGLEGAAVGGVALLVGFCAVALVLLIVVGVLYGLGLLLAGLLLIIPLIILVSLFPALAPFILVGGAAYWFFVHRKKKKATNAAG